MRKGQKYDQMVQNPHRDELRFFENYSEIMCQVQNQIRHINPHKIYDLGCGTGNLCGPLSKEFRVIGVDQSVEMLEHAKFKYPSMEIIKIDLHDSISSLLVEANTVIATSFVLHGIENKDALLKWFSESIRRGSKVIVVDYFFNNESERLSFIENLRNQGKTELEEIIVNRWYLKRDWFGQWAHQGGFKLNQTKLSSWIWLMELS